MKSTGVRTAVAGLVVSLVLAGCSSGSSGPARPASAPEEGPVERRPAGPLERTDTAGVSMDPEMVPRRTRLEGVDPDTVRAGRFDQGKMWTFEFPPLDYFENEYGLALDSAWFRKARLSALRIPSCSASFVSPNGLVMTNHHCAREAVTGVAEEGENLLDEGFYARSLAEERPVEDFHADQLVEIVDISDEVEERTLGLEGGNLLEAREEVLEDIAERMQEERGGEDAGWVVEPISLYNGARFSAYVFRRYENVKLVMAPELQIGFFGGDPDNFTYPRYNLDFSFLRVYDDQGEPLRTENYFGWSDRGAQAGEPVFIIGNPGSTSRLQTVAELEFRREIGDAHVLRFVRDRAEVLEEFIEAFPDEAEELDLRNLAFGLRNQEKAMEGQIRGLEDPAIIARRLATQREFLDSIRADSALAEAYAGLFDEMREIQEEKRDFADGLGAFLALGSEDLASPTLHRGLIAFQLLNAQRGGASSEQLQGLMDELRAVPDRPAALDQMLIEARIRDFVEFYGEDGELVASVLEGRTVEGAAAAIHEGSALSDSATAVRAAEQGRLTGDDPAVDFVRDYVPTYGQFAQGWGGLGQREEQIARRIGRARYEVYGTSQPPDATFSLRLADGVVRGYEYNGTVAPPVTTFYGLYDHYHSYRGSYPEPGDSPWDLPDRWLDPPSGFDLATPLNFVSTADIIGGNSGSPVVDQHLDVVGLVFDGNIESLPGDYIYLPEFNRSVSVDVRGILEALDDMYDMDRIVLELTTARLVETEEEADRVRR